MARKKILPKKLGPVKIPKNLRRIGDKALADPKVADIVAGAVASVGALVAARKLVKEVPGGAALTRSGASSRAVGGIADVVKQALEDVSRTRNDPQDEPGDKGKTKRRKDAQAASDSGIAEDAEPEKLH